MGRAWIVATPAHEEAFRRDWVEFEMPLQEMAALHGFKNINSVTRTAQRLGLPPRPGGPKRDPHLDISPVKLVEGEWVLQGNRLVWMDKV